MASQDTEITLGIGRMLAIFFGLVGVCAVCFGLGYSMGHSTGRTASVAVEAEPAKQLLPESKPAKGPAPEDLTFYKTVKQKDEDAHLTPESGASSAAPETEPTPAKPQPAAVRPARASAVVGNYMVQVAAVSRKEDADALLGALRKKSYNVSEAMNLPHDKLYHVQVGPFADIKEAESARGRLVSDGYNPIVKK
jgi:DedD protein